MPKRKPDRTQDTKPIDAVAVFYDELAKSCWQDALRVALDGADASATCDRRACQTAGCCQLVWTPGQPLVCRGGDIEAAVEKAASSVAFGCAMVGSFCGFEHPANPSRAAAKA